LRAQSSAADALIRLRDVQGAVLRGCQPDKELAAFVSVGGEKTRGVVLRANKLDAVKQPVLKTPDLPADAVAVDP
jgi:hypothetical protein